MDFLKKVKKIEKNEIDQIMQAVLARYRELFPEWEVSIISFEKGSDRNTDIDRMIAFLRKMKEK